MKRISLYELKSMLEQLDSTVLNCIAFENSVQLMETMAARSKLQRLYIERLEEALEQDSAVKKAA